MPVQSLSKSQMSKDPVLIRRFSLNQQAMHAQEFLRKEGIEAFIYMDAIWSGGGETQQGIQLVVKASDADDAFGRLRAYDTREEIATPNVVAAEKHEGRFYLQAAWFVSVLFAFLLGSFLTDKTLDSTEMAVGCGFLITAGYLFFVANMQKRKVHA